MSALKTAVQPEPKLICTDRLPDLVGRLPTPVYDRRALPGGIVHIGVGGFHRAHLAVYVDELLTRSRSEWSIVGAGLLPGDRLMADVLTAQDGLYVLIERDGRQAHGSVVGSIGEFVFAGAGTAALRQRLADQSTRIVSMTITESGYPVLGGQFVESVAIGDDATADTPVTTFGLLAASLDDRRRAGMAPFTVLSCDNLPGNGDVARTALLGAATMRSPDLAAWIERNGGFPNSMVDRITPATTDADRAFVLDTYGFVDRWPVSCEPFMQWALEDHFVLGRPSFEDVGVFMTQDVIPYEHMKLRLLNGSHSGLAYLSALAGIVLVGEALAVPSIERFVRQLMAREVAPNLPAPPGIDLADYQNSLVHRFANPAIGDQIARLCVDGSSKFPTFTVPSIEDQLARGGSVRLLALVLAGWCQYLRGRADDGTPLTLAHDPHLAEAIAAAEASREDPAQFLSYQRTFGPNLRHSTVFCAAFTEALASLQRVGALATIEAWTSTST
jgi:mannitol 2-dehydrogenase